LTELAGPLVPDEELELRDRLTAGAPYVVVSIPTGAGKSAVLGALLSDPALPSSGRTAKRSMAELNQLHSNLDRCDRVVVIYDPVDAYSGRSSVVTAPTTSIASPADAADHPWSSTIGSLFADQLGSSCSGRYRQHDAGEAFTFAPELNTANSSPRLAWFSKYVLACLWQELLRLFNRMRMILRLRLIYVLTGLSRIPEAINFVLLLLAAARFYRRRTEPSDYTLPVLTSMSVVIGETARLC
jgi:hypothetical protein